MPGGLFALVLALATCSPAGRAMISEVFYDAPGDDEGVEFVELFNPGAAPCDLTGVKLEAGDGAGAGRWTTRWTAPAGTVVAPGARYLIGGARVTPTPDAVVELSLQNGPDAVRIVWPDGAAEVVGYGALGWPEYFCGAPAIDVASGQSLARIPDDSDLGGNAVDFRAAGPSPGRANLPRRRADWVAGRLAIIPEQPPPATAARLHGSVRNAGAEPWSPGELEVVVTEVRDGAPGLVTRIPLGAGAMPGDTLDLDVSIQGLGAGAVTLRLGLELTGEEGPPSLDSLRVRVGAGPVEITEVQFHPAHGEGEWVEIANRTHGALDLRGHTLLDRSDTRGVPDTAARCPAESLCVLAQNRPALLAAYPELDPSRVWSVRPWPALNNSNDETGTADAVRWRDADDLPSDRVDYSATWAPSGVPIERAADGAWRASLDPGGSPGRPGREPSPIAGVFALARPVVRSSDGAARMIWFLPWPTSDIRVDAYDLSGRHAGVLLPSTRVASRGERNLPIAPLQPGLYVLLLRAQAPSGDSTLAARRVLRVAGRWR